AYRGIKYQPELTNELTGGRVARLFLTSTLMPAWIKHAIPIAQIVVSVLLIGLILVQGKGTGLSGVFGGEGNVFRTKRGAERVIFIIIIVMVALFFGVSLLNVYANRTSA